MVSIRSKNGPGARARDLVEPRPMPARRLKRLDSIHRLRQARRFELLPTERLSQSGTTRRPRPRSARRSTARARVLLRHTGATVGEIVAQGLVASGTGCEGVVRRASEV